MGLPANNTAWPPAKDTDRYSRMRVTSTWYGGDPDKLAALYAGPGQANTQTGIKYALTRVFGWFWSKSDPTAPDDKIHVPIAQDIATMSSELLFAEPPRFTVQHTQFTADGTPDPAQAPAVAKAQARLDRILDGCGFDALLLAAAEVSAALGSTGLRIAWDKRAGTTMPVITRVDADACVPEYSWGQLVAVTFWEVAKRDGQQVWYHLERHEPGAVYHGLYMGEQGNLGKAVPLTDAPSTVHLAPLVDADSKIRTVPNVMTAVSIPNMLPDPLDRSANAGRSDFTPGVLSLFDAIDKTYTSLMRDIEDARSRLIVADYMLESNGPGRGVSFDADQHIFTKLKMSPSDDGGDAPITQVQFAMRVTEHIQAIDMLTKRAVKSCGYNSDAENGDNGGDMTATEYSGKAKRSMTTRAKKLRYWQQVERLLTGLLAIDAAYFGSGITPLPVKMEVPNAVQPSLKELAETASLMKQAEAASVRVRVEVMHPDWEPSRIDDEVDLILREQGIVDPSTFGLPKPGGEGAPLPTAPGA